MHQFTTQLTLFLENTVAPISNELDFHRDLLQKCYQKWIELGGLRLLVPCEYGGLGFERLEWIDYTSQLAEYSGALLFLQAQHQYAISRLKKLLPDTSIASTLKSIVEKNKGIGVAFAANKKILTIKKHINGFSVSGVLKWVTGWDYLSDILISFDNDGVDYYCFLPFKTTGSSLVLSPLLEPIVFSAANTVMITLKDYFISSNDIITSHLFQPKTPSEHPGIYSFLGASKALLKIAATGKYQHNAYVKSSLKQLLEEWETYRNKVMQSTENPFRLKATGLKFAEKCLSFAKLVCGSQGLLSTHPLTRLNREIWQYSIGGYSEDQLEAYLDFFK